MNATFLDAAQLRYLSTHTPLYYSPEAALVPWLPDNLLALAAPIIAYWVLSITFHAFDMSEWKRLDKYRLHESAEVKSRNLVTRTQVIVAVIFQHIVQTAIGLLWIEDKPAGAQIDHVANMAKMAPYLEWAATGLLGKEAGAQLLVSRGAEGLYTVYWWAIPAAKFLLGMFIIDTWQYFLHRAMHMNTYLYKKFHSWHHRLYVPYAFGALYNHPVEGFLLDTCGAGLAEWIVHMSTREAMLLFVVSTLKTVDDHCGYKLPWDPLQMFSPNNADYHDIHHQVIGIKSNFSQPFFIHWDAILGTRMTRQDIELRRAKQEKPKAQ
ncbi:sphingosine hydroxylase [Lentinus tigrinus ALCF2SS1-7]|uniref:Sphingosine hydroxylase n=1 Tax=Lentinus tigrinus ALCF2SS1-6 TaxID=1328759 RepID=A0A5C2SKF0_9APHY|nr:sphingosine hydroxylase [Lentinus tigrinus ALCF2SS1-6]RPD76544.1 sphingosine hydroxylase [Lentinus tigrinus ALCF2SS1-7]